MIELIMISFIIFSLLVLTGGLCLMKELNKAVKMAYLSDAELKELSDYLITEITKDDNFNQHPGI